MYMPEYYKELDKEVEELDYEISALNSAHEYLQTVGEHAEAHDVHQQLLALERRKKLLTSSENRV